MKKGKAYYIHNTFLTIRFVTYRIEEAENNGGGNENVNCLQLVNNEVEVKDIG